MTPARLLPERSTLRLSALCYARGMVLKDDYRDFRRTWLEALIAGEPLPELPAEWQSPPPPAEEEDAEPAPPVRRPGSEPRPSRHLVWIAIGAALLVALLALSTV